jgi:hypothetical protein
MTRTDVLLVPSVPIRLLVNLVNFESLGSRAVELVAGVPCTDLSHKCICIFSATTGQEREKKRNASRKRSARTGGSLGEREKLIK